MGWRGAAPEAMKKLPTSFMVLPCVAESPASAEHRETTCVAALGRFIDSCIAAQCHSM